MYFSVEESAAGAEASAATASAGASVPEKGASDLIEKDTGMFYIVNIRLV